MPGIAFGIALQFFGGLRRGEVVNLTAGCIPTDFLSGSNYVAVLDNQHNLFRHLQNTTKEQVVPMNCKGVKVKSVCYVGIGGFTLSN